MRTLKAVRLYIYCEENGDNYENYLLLLEATFRRCWLDYGRLTAARDAGAYLTAQELAELRELSRFLVEARSWVWFFTDDSHS